MIRAFSNHCNTIVIVLQVIRTNRFFVAAGCENTETLISKKRTQARRNEKNSGGAINYEILSPTMVGRRRKFFISNRLKGLGKLNICRRQVM